MPLGDGLELDILAHANIGLKRCPHCHVANPAIIFKMNFDITPARPELLRGLGSQLHWTIYTCQTCGGVIAGATLKSANGQFVRGKGGVGLIEWLVPAPNSIDAALPPRVARYLTQAQETLTSPAASIVMSAAAIDAILKEKDYKDGSLSSRIEQAAKDSVITSEMATVAHDVRLGANDERHADDDAEPTTAEDAQRCFDFAEALAEMIFILPKRVKRITATRKP